MGPEPQLHSQDGANNAADANTRTLSLLLLLLASLILDHWVNAVLR